MTIADLLGNEELRRHEFPVARGRIHLAHAAVSPLPRRVADAVREYATQASVEDQEGFVLAGLLRETRALAAQFVGAQADEIALVGPTSLALSLVAAGFPLRKGDNVVIYFDDFPSNVFPWMALAERGVQVRLLPVRELGRIELVDVMGQVDEQTRLVALASCHFISGWRLDLAPLAGFLRERGVAFCVDGIQTLGAFPTLAAHADFIAADAHKWMLGPCGAGLLFVRREWQDRVRPVALGWNNVRCPNYWAPERIEFRRGAHRFEAGTHGILGLVGFRAALQLLLEVGIESIAAELLRKRAWLVSALEERGWEVLHARSPAAHASGIIAAHRPDRDLAALHRELGEAGIMASLRHDRGGRAYLRFSPHFYNTDEELGRVVERM